MDKKEQKIEAFNVSATGIQIGNADDALLVTFGYKPELKRNFTPFEIFAVGFSVVGVLPSIASVLVFVIPCGGAVGMVWGWAVCGAFLMCIALAMAELGSVAPIAGGLYFWTFMFSSPRWRNFLAWTVGYSNTIGYVSAVASCAWGCTVQLMAAASIGSSFKFQPATLHYYGVYCLLLLIQGCICTLSPAVVARLQRLFVALNMLAAFVIIFAVPFATPKSLRNNAAYAFGNFTNLTTWSDGFAFILSFLSPFWAVGAFDCTLHISEEAVNANVAVPYGLVLSTLAGLVLGWGVNVALVFSMGSDTDAILKDPVGQPLAMILFNSIGSKGTLVLWALIVILQFVVGIDILTAASRQMFAFVRDGGLPFSKFLYKVDSRVHAPVRCVWFAVTISLFLGLFSFAGPNVISTVFSLVICSANFSYAIPIAARYLGGRKIKPGPFHLGKLSLPIAIIAVTWLIVTMVIFLFPTYSSPNASDMNYAVVVMGGLLFLSTVYFYFPKYGGKHWFKGPIRHINASGLGDLKDYIL